MLLLDQLAEQRIQQAVDDGTLENLPGAGEPLDFEDDRLIPEELRMAHKILKNAGYAPPEVIDRKSIAALRAELQRAEEETERRRICGKINCLQARLGDRGDLLLKSDYYGRLLDRFAGSDASTAQSD